MRVAIPVWEDRISPVFDAARTFLVADIEDGRVAGRRLLLCGASRQGEVVRLLLEAEVQVVICGAISREPARLIEERGIRLIPFIAGMAEHVLNRYVCGYSITTYQMPGCCGNGRRRTSRCRRLADQSAVRNAAPDEEKI